ncbi:MAG: hypothetical protein K2L62_06620, partial [Muribaculaceae bacterium]|nr:hypothetical protein [Muribaculaceae bacterium]
MNLHNRKKSSKHSPLSLMRSAFAAPLLAAAAFSAAAASAVPWPVTPSNNASRQQLEQIFAD